MEENLPKEELNRLSSPSDSDRIENLTNLAALPPAYIISQAWLRIEEQIAQSVNTAVQNTEQRQTIPPSQLLRLARQRELLHSDEFNILDNLRRLRNEAAHSLNPDISLTDALSTTISQVASFKL